MDDNKRKWFILFNVSLGIFMATLDGGIVNLALPTIMASFSIDLATIQWVVTSYLLTISSFLPIFGRLADILGKKRLYSMGFLVFGAGSLLCALSNSIEFLILSRIAQALGASILMSLGQGIVTATFPPNERGRALGITGSVVAVGSLFGPGAGGILVQSFGWQSVFFINIPIGIIGFIVSQMALKHDTSEAKEKFDYLGSVLFILGISLLFFSLSSFEGDVYGRGLLFSLLAGGAALIAGFIITELKVSDPLVDLKLFKSYVFTLGVVSAFIIFMTMYTTTILMPFYLH
jgi:EmrB/QacA subfamily drug resistance transporter